MGQWKTQLLEIDKDDDVTLRCDRCSEDVPYHDAVVWGEPPSIAEAEQVRARRDWIPALCSYCDHMMRKDD